MEQQARYNFSRSVVACVLCGVCGFSCLGTQCISRDAPLRTQIQAPEFPSQALQKWPPLLGFGALSLDVSPRNQILPPIFSAHECSIEGCVAL